MEAMAEIDGLPGLPSYKMGGFFHGELAQITRLGCPWRKYDGWTVEPPQTPQSIQTV